MVNECNKIKPIESTFKYVDKEDKARLQMTITAPC